MIIFEIQSKDFFKKNIREQLVESIKIYGVVKPLQRLFWNEKYEKQLIFMRNLPEKTIGNDIAKILDKYGLRIIPFFENHDLKHLILGYEMTTEDEIKMQAYLFGNGNYTISCVLFLLSGLLFPSLWKVFYSEYRKGKDAPSILQLSIQDCLEMETNKIRKKYQSRFDI